MKLSIITPSGFLKHLWPELHKLGHDLLINSVSPDCDYIICFSISQMDLLEQAHRLFPAIPIINYHWDIYEWHLKNPRPNDYNWGKYKIFLQLSKEVWVPSEVTKRRTKELLGVDSEVVKTFATLFDKEPKDKDYVLDPWRPQPDKCCGWTVQACAKLNIPCVSPQKGLNWEEWKETIANCSFIVSCHEEASTGSLAIIEAAYLDKMTLCNNSEYSAAKEYLNGAGMYFDGYQDLKKKIKFLWENRQTQKLDWLKEEYSAKKMAERINQRLENLYHAK